MKFLKYGLITASLLSFVNANSLSEAFKAGEVSAEARYIYLYDKSDDKSIGVDGEIEGFAVGGNLGYESGDYNGFKVGARFYTSHGLGESEDSTADTLLLNSKESFSILGQAYVSYSIGNTLVKVGRQQIDTPLAGSDDIRIVPNLFEAALIVNSDLPNTTLIGAHVTKMAGVIDSSADDGTKFESMSIAALGNSNPIGDEAVSTVAVIFSNEDLGLTLQAWDYYAYEIVNAIYLQADYGINSLALSAQYWTYSTMGKLEDTLNSLGTDIDYSVYGLQAGYEISKATITAGFNKVSDDKMGASLFGTWGAYPEFVFADETWFYSYGTDAKDSTAYSLALDYDFSQLGLDGLTSTLKYVKFDLENDDLDSDIIDILADYALNDNFSVGATYENSSSDTDAFNRDIFKLRATYNF